MQMGHQALCTLMKVAAEDQSILRPLVPLLVEESIHQLRQTGIQACPASFVLPCTPVIVHCG